MVTIYYVNCIRCKQEIGIQRRLPGKNIVTGFGATWNVDIICQACGTKAHYGYDDVRKKHAAPTQPEHQEERDPDEAPRTPAKANGEALRGHAWSESSIKANAPQSSGVYAIYGAVWIYIGESTDVQSRLLEHWKGDKACITRADPTGFVFEVCDLAERVRRRTALVAQFRPLCNQRGELKPTPSM